jgi:hypothetical protein
MWPLFTLTRLLAKYTPEAISALSTGPLLCAIPCLLVIVLLIQSYHRGLAYLLLLPDVLRFPAPVRILNHFVEVIKFSFKVRKHSPRLLGTRLGEVNAIHYYKGFSTVKFLVEIYHFANQCCGNFTIFVRRQLWVQLQLQLHYQWLPKVPSPFHTCV